MAKTKGEQLAETCVRLETDSKGQINLYLVFPGRPPQWVGVVTAFARRMAYPDFIKWIGGIIDEVWTQ